MKVLNKFLKNGTGNYVEGVVNGRTGSGPVRSTSCETTHNTFKIASWNIGTMRGRSSEIVETITRRNIDLCCVQEVRWRGASARHIIGKDSRYKFFWVGNNQGTSGVGVLLAEKWVDKVYDIKRVSDRIMLIKLLVGEVVLTVLSVYAPPPPTRNLDGSILNSQGRAPPPPPPVLRGSPPSRVADDFPPPPLHRNSVSSKDLPPPPPRVGPARSSMSFPPPPDDSRSDDAFYDSLQTVISELPDKEIVIPCGDWKVFMEVLGMVNVMQMVIESLNLLLQMILSLGILSLSKEIVTLSLTNLAMQKPRLTSFF